VHIKHHFTQFYPF